MHTVICSRQGRAIGNTILQRMDIGAPSCSLAAALKACVVLVYGQQRPYEMRISVHMVRRYHGIIFQCKPLVRHGLLYHSQHRFFCGTDWTPAVKYAFQSISAYSQHTESKGQSTGQLVFHADSGCLSAGIAVREKLQQVLHHIHLGALCKRQACQVHQQACKGIFSLLGCGCMGALPLGSNCHNR